MDIVSSIQQLVASLDQQIAECRDAEAILEDESYCENRGRLNALEETANRLRGVLVASTMQAA